MTIYLIESPDGQYLMNPEDGFLTTNIDEAWFFYPCQSLIYGYKSGRGIDPESESALEILCPLQEEGALEDYIIRRHIIHETFKESYRFLIFDLSSNEKHHFQ